MTRIGAADGYTYAPHGIDGAGHAGLAEDNIFYGLGLLFFNILLRNNRRALRFVLCRFLSRVGRYDDIPCRNVSVPPLQDCPPHRRAEPAKSGRHTAGEDTSSSCLRDTSYFRSPPSCFCHSFFVSDIGSLYFILSINITVFIISKDCCPFHSIRTENNPIGQK